MHVKFGLHVLVTPPKRFLCFVHTDVTIYKKTFTYIELVDIPAH
jgi:hypothetical protein